MGGNELVGGGSGIRTHDTVSRIHAFQACAFSHSAIPPAGETRNIARRVRQTTGDVRGARGWTKAVADTMIEPDTDGRHRDRAQHRYLASILPPDAGNDEEPSSQAMTNEPRTLSIDRRTLLGGFAAALIAPRHGFAATATDATGRTITAPDRVTRVYPAGPPAAVRPYPLAPVLFMGWFEPLGAAEREFLLPEVAARPQVPRLTGRGGAGQPQGRHSPPPPLLLHP